MLIGGMLLVAYISSSSHLLCASLVFVVHLRVVSAIGAHLSLSTRRKGIG
ncbi:hypothetical protein OROGR_012093 [Orobanche gracilis]